MSPHPTRVVNPMKHLRILPLFLLTWIVASAYAETTLQVDAFDIPGDRGDSIGLSWPASKEDAANLLYVVYTSDSADGPFAEAARVPANTKYESDEPRYFGFSVPKKERHFTPVGGAEEIETVGKRKSKTYVKTFCKVALVEPGPDGSVENVRELAVSGVVSATPVANWFAPHKTNNLILALLTSGFILFFIQRATKNPNIFIRKLAGLEAIDEAVGRATEMGKPILYLTGYHDIDRVSTMASVNILSHVAHKVAEFDSRLMIPSKWSITMTVCQEVVKEAYTNAGRPDAYNANDVYFIAGEQFSYTAAVDGVMVREKPAANFFLGTFAAEALILAETGASTGAIQISGTDSTFQIPFFVVACDYCLIGEELYAASAYLSREPKLLGSLKGQDAGKFLIMAAILVGTVLITIQGFLDTPPHVFSYIKEFFTAL